MKIKKISAFFVLLIITISLIYWYFIDKDLFNAILSGVISGGLALIGVYITLRYEEKGLKATISPDIEQKIEILVPDFNERIFYNHRTFDIQKIKSEFQTYQYEIDISTANKTQEIVYFFWLLFKIKNIGQTLKHFQPKIGDELEIWNFKEDTYDLIKTSSKKVIKKNSIKLINNSSTAFTVVFKIQPKNSLSSFSVAFNYSFQYEDILGSIYNEEKKVILSFPEPRIPYPKNIEIK